MRLLLGHDLNPGELPPFYRRLRGTSYLLLLARCLPVKKQEADTMEESLTESTVLVDIAPQPVEAEKKSKKPPSALAAVDSTILRLNK